MSHLGSFGAAAKEISGDAEPDTFQFFGDTFKVVGAIPPMLAIQLGAAATGKVGEEEGMGAMWETLRTALTAPATDGRPEDETQFVAFYRSAVNHRCNIDELMKLAFALFEAQTGRPTEEPQGSSPGPTSTSPSSNTSSSAHPAFAHLTPVNEVLAG